MSPDAWTEDAEDLRDYLDDLQDTGLWELLPAREDLEEDVDTERTLIGQSSYCLRWTHPSEPVYVTVSLETQYMEPQVWYWGRVTIYNPGFTVGINKKDPDLSAVLEWAVDWMQEHPDPGFLVDDPEYANRYTRGGMDPGHDYA